MVPYMDEGCISHPELLCNIPPSSGLSMKTHSSTEHKQKYNKATKKILIE